MSPLTLLHSPKPPMLGADTPIWHIRLTEPSGRLRLRAVGNAGDVDLFPAPQLSTLTKQHRSDIVTYGERERSNAVVAEEFILTALGATARLRGEWVNRPGQPLLSLSAWVNDSVIGRDQYVETVERGLFPFGHRATKTRISQREAVGSIAGLVRHDVLTVQEPERRYDENATQRGYQYNGREMPFKSIRVNSVSSQPVADVAIINVTATDSANNEVTFSVSTLFVTLDEAKNVEKLTELTERYHSGLGLVHLLGSASRWPQQLVRQRYGRGRRCAHFGRVAHRLDA